MSLAGSRKTVHVCGGKLVYKKGGGDGPVLYREGNYRDWFISSSDHATSCENGHHIWDGTHCWKSPGAGGCVG
eukprot:COSAG05_NODE_13300_length_435_cov_0.589286_1_plen_72_part_10